MPKLKKLDARGVAHHFMLALVVLGLAVFGVYRLVASRAATCGAMSDPVSGTTCTPTSSPTSGSLRCSISGVPATVSAGDVFTPRVTLTNTSTAHIDRDVESEVTNGAGQVQYFPGILFSLDPGASQTKTLGIYTVSGATNGTRGTVHALDGASSTGYGLFDCTKTFSPAPPVTSVTVFPSDWTRKVNATVTTDRGFSVIKLGAKTASSTGSVSTNPTAQSNLLKLNKFLSSNRGKKVKACYFARSDTGSTLTMQLSYIVQATSSTPVLYDTNLTNSYTQKCFAFTAATQDSASRNLSMTVRFGAAVYLQGVVFTVL